MRYTPISGEKWKQIKDADEGYKISTLGRIGSSKYGDFRILKTYYAGKGYVMCDMRKDGKTIKRYVHRLVAQHFIPNPDNLPEVNHKDGNKGNNIELNLNWTDGVNNMKHAREVLGFDQRGENSKNSKLTESDVIAIRERYAKGEHGCPTIAKDYNVHYGHIWNVVNRITWKHI